MPKGQLGSTTLVRVRLAENGLQHKMRGFVVGTEKNKLSSPSNVKVPLKDLHFYKQHEFNPKSIIAYPYPSTSTPSCQRPSKLHLRYITTFSFLTAPWALASPTTNIQFSQPHPAPFRSCCPPPSIFQKSPYLRLNRRVTGRCLGRNQEIEEQEEGKL